MIKRLCYISRNYRNTTTSGNKAKTDNEMSLDEMDAFNLGLDASYHKNKVLHFLLDLAGVARLTMTVRRGDVVVLQYPIKKYFSFICRTCHWHGARVITLIHDLGSMRRKKLTERQEIARLMHADYVIASNATMRQWLSDRGYTHGLGQLELFDYRSQAATPRRAPLRQGELPAIIYAGALARRKNTFLLKMADEARHYRLVVYGNRNGLPGLNDSDHVEVKGFMDSEEFIAHVPGHFGLVWDGDSLKECTGNFGEYLRWNSPHKASFYLRAGLPVIVWSQSALAPIVEREGIGLVIDRLDELNNLLANISTEKYQDMLTQVTRVSNMLSRGEFFKKALRKAMKEMEPDTNV